MRNPAQMEVSAFLDKDVRGFGLLQRDRNFDHYQDLDLAYELRPSYWVEPKENWGEGRVELVELPTPRRGQRQYRRLLGAAMIRPIPPSR